MGAAAIIEEPKTSAKLIRPREEAISFLQNQVKKGLEIKALRIRTGPELDSARGQKLDWTNQTTDMLKEFFDSPSVAEECNDWVGKIYPEYAEFGNFVEQFNAEMDHRLKRLKAVVKQIQKLPSETRASAPEAAVVTAPTAAASVIVAPKLTNDDLHGLIVSFGADDATRDAMAAFLGSLEAQTTVIDAANAAGGLTQALENAEDANFAVLLAAEGQPEQSFELGFCVGRLGLNRVCVAHPGHVQLQPDPRGLTHVSLDAGGGWQLVIARHLKRAGLEIDLNRLC